MRKLILGYVFIFVVTVPLMADYPTIKVQEVGVVPSTGVYIISSGYDGGVYTGVYQLNLKDASPAVPGLPYGPNPVTVDAFCIDLYDLSPGAYQTYSVMPLDLTPDKLAGPMGESRAHWVAELLDNYWVTGMSDTSKTALQLAVWEVVDEKYMGNPVKTDFNILTGNFSAPYISGSLKSTVDAMLSSLTDDGVSFDGYMGLSNHATVENKDQTGLYQDYVVRVPVPGAVLLAFLGLSAAGLKLRKMA